MNNNNNGDDDDQLGAISSFSYSSSSSSSCYGLSSRNNNGDDQIIHVLAVDDNLIDRILVEKLLKNSACKVTTAENAMRALEYLGLGEDQQNNSKVMKVNLILTDYCMPGMTGYDLLKKIKESSHMKEVPVVIMSSENVPTRISKCLEEGAQMFMLKPLKLSDIKKMRCQVMQCGHY